MTHPMHDAHWVKMHYALVLLLFFQCGCIKLYVQERWMNHCLPSCFQSPFSVTPTHIPLQVSLFCSLLWFLTAISLVSFSSLPSFFPGGALEISGLVLQRSPQWQTLQIKLKQCFRPGPSKAGRLPFSFIFSSLFLFLSQSTSFCLALTYSLYHLFLVSFSSDIFFLKGKVWL